MNEYITVARTSDVPPGSCIQRVVAGKPLALFNVGGKIHALEGVCLHRGGPVGEGDLEDTIVTCPWHGWQYDVTTGRNVFDDSIGLQTYDVHVEDGEVQVALP
jgi:nitrite reductase/ring-hydroxylating ferredoxin subunit